jgi:hypothetical protein
MTTRHRAGGNAGASTPKERRRFRARALTALADLGPPLLAASEALDSGAPEIARPHFAAALAVLTRLLQ